jgi:hypothetical protein
LTIERAHSGPLVASCAGLALSALAAGCTFPEVTFSDVPDGSGRLTPGLDATAPDVNASGGDDDAMADSPTGADTGDAAATMSSDGGCDFNGTWATRITIDVSWMPQGLNSVILSPGTGQIIQWVKGIRVQSPTAPMALSDDSVVCGIQLPDFQSTTTEVYGVRFPDTLFDDQYLPPFTVNGALTRLSGDGGLGYSTTETAVLIGLTMTNPTQDPWPATITTQDDEDHDNAPGVTVAAAQGPLSLRTPTASTYSYVPTNIPLLPLEQPVRASSLYLATRQVTIVSGKVQDCNTITGTVDIPTINSKPAIDSHILGCALVDGGACTTGSSSQTSFVDNSQPVFTPSGPTDFQSVRLDAGATCADVRGAFH